MNVYDFKVKEANGNEKSLKDYEGKVVLIINSATECGFTPQYEILQSLYEKYEKDGFVVLDFPCNQFGNQAPGSNHEIATFCSSRYGITFPIFSKVDVNGENQDALFAYLKEQKGFEGLDLSTEIGAFLDGHLKKINPDYASNDDIKWNFTKFLVDKAGNVVSRFEPTHDMAAVEEAIKNLL